MPVEVTCDGCQRRLRLPDSVAGKRIKCPKCAAVIAVPALAAAEMWYMQTEDGQQYGPVPREELDAWVAEGRVTAECQILLEGDEQWQWAADVYPALAGEVSPAFAETADPGAETVSAAQFNFAGGGAPAEAAPAGGPFVLAADDLSPTARVSGRRGPKRRKTKSGPAEPSGLVTAIAVVNFILGGLQLMCGALTLLTSQLLLAFLSGVAAEDPAGASPEVEGQLATLRLVLIGICLLWLLTAVLLFASGYGLTVRAQWGRMLAMVAAGIVGGFGAILAVANILLIFSPTSLMMALFYIGYGAWVIMTMLHKRFAAEFS